jgi:P-type E1-E2 ATPase
VLKLEIPGRKTFFISKIVLDLNGTLTEDGRLREETLSLLNRVAGILQVYILTADTFGSAAQINRELKADIHVLCGENTSAAKAMFLEHLGPEQVIAVGNGSNDAGMLEKAAIGIAVLGPEGCSVEALRCADLLVKSVNDALLMVLKPQRLAATLRR